MSFYEQPLAKLYEESPAVHTGDSVIHAYTAPSDTLPSWAIRQSLYYPHYTAQNHQDHLQALQEHGIHVPGLRIEGEYIAAEWVQARMGFTSLLLESDYRSACNDALDGLEGYYKWAKAAGSVILHDIFGLQQFVFGTTHTNPDAPRLWLVDIDTVIRPVERFPSPVGAMRDALHIFTSMESAKTQP